MNSKKIVLKNKWIKKCIIFVFLIFIIVPLIGLLSLFISVGLINVLNCFTFDY